MANEILVGIVGFGGVVAGAAIQFIASIANEKWKHTRAMQTESYKLLMKAIAGRAHADKNSDEKMAREYKLMLAEAKAQIALYGSERAVAATAKFFLDHARIDGPESAEAFMDMAEAMRNDSFAKNYQGFRQDYNDLLLVGAR
jgi:hypothetical protein